MIWLREVLPKDVETLFGQKFGCCSVGGRVGKGEVNLRSALGVRGGGWIEGGKGRGGKGMGLLWCQVRGNGWRTGGEGRGRLIGDGTGPGLSALGIAGC